MNLFEVTFLILVLLVTCAVSIICTMAGFSIVGLCVLAALIISILFLVYKGVI